MAECAKEGAFKCQFNGSILVPNPGPFSANPSMLLLNNETLEVLYRFDYYMYGQFSKFVRRGAMRVSSSHSGTNEKGLAHVAFVNSEDATGAGNAGATVVVVANTAPKQEKVHLRHKGLVSEEIALPPKSVS